MKLLVIAAAATMIAGSAFAQKAPVPQTGNLDASTQTQIEQTEGATKSGDAKIDLNTTQSTSGAGGMNANNTDSSAPEFKDPGNLESSTKDNLEGR